MNLFEEGKCTYAIVAVMPLLANARLQIQVNLEQVRDGARPALIKIGELTTVQLNEINIERYARALPPITGEVLFVGRHIYRSRIEGDGYTIQDVVEQIVSAMSSGSTVVVSTKMTTIENQTPRQDGYGNAVTDRAIFECSARHPRPELFSVIPRGDVTKPQIKKGPPVKATP